MKKLTIALGLLFISMSANADVYPGDSAFSGIVQTVYTNMSEDNIQMNYDTSIGTRNQLCSKLVNRHNTYTSSNRISSNASFIGVTLTQLDCLNALWYSDGYNSSAGWNAWAGVLSGSWWNDVQTAPNGNVIPGVIFSDPATWHAPIKQSSNQSDGRIYDFQSVFFSDRENDARYGWNMSHPDVAYVWGWDPKDNVNRGGLQGAHVGWTFEKSGAQCIIWATPDEAFLECVKPKCTGKQRVSTGFFGVGQWSIGSTSCLSGNTSTTRSLSSSIYRRR